MIESAAEFYRLRSSEDPEEYGRAAREEAPESVWMEVISLYPDMKKWVAHNKSVPVQVLAILAADPDWRVRFMVASKRKLPEHLQLDLARDTDVGIRLRVACNAKATRLVLQFLAEDEDEEVRDRARSRLAIALD